MLFPPTGRAPAAPGLDGSWQVPGGKGPGGGPGWPPAPGTRPGSGSETMTAERGSPDLPGLRGSACSAAGKPVQSLLHPNRSLKSPPFGASDNTPLVPDPMKKGLRAKPRPSLAPPLSYPREASGAERMLGFVSRRQKGCGLGIPTIEGVVLTLSGALESPGDPPKEAVDRGPRRPPGQGRACLACVGGRGAPLRRHLQRCILFQLR